MNISHGRITLIGVRECHSRLVAARGQDRPLGGHYGNPSGLYARIPDNFDTYADYYPINGTPQGIFGWPYSKRTYKPRSLPVARPVPEPSAVASGRAAAKPVSTAAPACVISDCSTICPGACYLVQVSFIL